MTEELKIDIKELFLRNFVIELIKNTKQNNLQIAQEHQEIVSPFKQEETAARRELSAPYVKLTPAPSAIRLASIVPQPPASQFSQQQSVRQTQAKQISRQPTTTQISSLTKLSPLIKDPAITEIECPGANESLLVKKGGAIQQTKVILTENEIKSILNEFSEKTKIPIIEGTFKAALDNLIMIAVISEILGPRFIIQKKNPFQPLFS